MVARVRATSGSGGDVGVGGSVKIGRIEFDGGSGSPCRDRDRADADHFPDSLFWTAS